MSRSFMRVWMEGDPSEISKKLLIAGELFSTCGNCKCLGLDFQTSKVCPECHATFEYVTALKATSASSEKFYWIKKIRAARPELCFIDYDDFKKGQDLKRARDILG